MFRLSPQAGKTLLQNSEFLGGEKALGVKAGPGSRPPVGPAEVGSSKLTAWRGKEWAQGLAPAGSLFGKRWEAWILSAALRIWGPEEWDAAGSYWVVTTGENRVILASRCLFVSLRISVSHTDTCS